MESSYSYWNKWTNSLTEIHWSWPFKGKPWHVCITENWNIHFWGVFHHLKVQDYKALNLTRKVSLEDGEGEMFPTEITSILMEEMAVSHDIYVSKCLTQNIQMLASAVAAIWWVTVWEKWEQWHRGINDGPGNCKIRTLFLILAAELLYELEHAEYFIFVINEVRLIKSSIRQLRDKQILVKAESPLDLILFGGNLK